MKKNVQIYRSFLLNLHPHNNTQLNKLGMHFSQPRNRCCGWSLENISQYTTYCMKLSKLHTHFKQFLLDLGISDITYRNRGYNHIIHIAYPSRFNYFLNVFS